MIKGITVSEAKPRLGSLLDQVTKGKELLIRRKQRLYRIEEVAEIDPIPVRPFGYFKFDNRDELVALSNRAEPSFTPPDEH